jgi:hypothetical protein
VLPYEVKIHSLPPPVGDPTEMGQDDEVGIGIAIDNGDFVFEKKPTFLAAPGAAPRSCKRRRRHSYGPHSDNVNVQASELALLSAHLTALLQDVHRDVKGEGCFIHDRCCSSAREGASAGACQDLRAFRYSGSPPDTRTRKPIQGLSASANLKASNGGRAAMVKRAGRLRRHTLRKDIMLGDIECK